VQLTQYVRVGGSSATVGWPSFGILVGTTNIFYQAAVVFGCIAATATNYFLSARFVLACGRHSPFQEVNPLHLPALWDFS